MDIADNEGLMSFPRLAFMLMVSLRLIVKIIEGVLFKIDVASGAAYETRN
jgi:hypothetical protein